MIARPGVRWLLAAALVPILLGAQRIAGPDDEALVRAGNAAFDQGAYARAAALYEKASDRTTDPGLVAFNLATARYHLARQGNAQALADAEQGYRCCLEKGNPCRARAWFGLGNCLLLRAAGTSLDRVALRSAIDCFAQCLRDPECTAALKADARYNRQRALLLLLQAPPSPDSAGEETPTDEDKPENPPESLKQPENREGDSGADNSDKGSKAEVGKEGDTQKGNDVESGQAPGRGTLPPVPDTSESSPLAAADALEHLQQATRRILAEIRQHRKVRARPAGPGVRDW